ncbi:tyrosine-protein phosphatase [Ferruginibacter sp. SUN002]|uniref:tyrosine-protein phosphatase n=1 Tax=Ferruginibacter sp. SUN002 TaxID=2937789 RepID=UPI003D365236
MFSFFKRSNSGEATLTTLPVSTDIHSHILPGIDDGSPDIDTSLSLVRGLYELGIRETVATPHVIGDLYRNTPETINAALLKLQEACAAAAIDIRISAAAEYMMDDNFMRLLKDKNSLLTIKDKVVLTEQPYTSQSDYLREISFDLATEGYKPIMAHPERYYYYHEDYEKYSYLKDLGFTLQVNLLSLTGYYGKPVAKAAKYIFDNDLADYVGTDLHHDRHLAALQHKGNLNLFKKYLSKRAYNVL